jgi:hypothetical protein
MEGADVANDSTAENVVQMRPPRKPRPVESVKPPMTAAQRRENARRGIAKARAALAKARIKAVPDER